MSSRGPSGGFTLLELLVVLVLLGVLASIAAPSLQGVLEVHRVRGVLQVLAGDLYLARMQAVQLGQRVQVEFVWDAGEHCIQEYRIRLRNDESHVLKRVSVESRAPAVCLTSNNASMPLVFSSRGLPYGIAARTLVARSGKAADSLVLSQLGRVLRRY